MSQEDIKQMNEIRDELEMLLNLVPNDLKPNQEIEKQCPFCSSKIKISRASNNHLWIVCKKEGVLLCQWVKKKKQN